MISERTTFECNSCNQEFDSFPEKEVSQCAECYGTIHIKNCDSWSMNIIIEKNSNIFCDNFCYSDWIESNHNRNNQIRFSFEKENRCF